MQEKNYITFPSFDSAIIQYGCNERPKKNVIIRGEGEREKRNKWSELRDASLPMISCGLAQRNRLKTVFCRRENHGVVGRDQVLTRPSLGAAPTVPLGKRDPP